MKKNGFTLIELITTFSIVTVVTVILINIVVIIKDIYVKYEIKTEMLINQGNLNKKINSKIINGNLDSISECENEDNCYEFNVIEDGNPKQYVLRVNDGTISFDDYIYKAKENISIGDLNVRLGKYLSVKIPIKHKLYTNDDFGLNLVYVGNYKVK